jgi:P-type Cu+ transporter
MKRSLALGLIAASALVPAALMAQEAPKKSEAPVLCVVRGTEIADPTKAAGKFDVNGKTYYVCCGGCKAKFEKSGDADRAKMAKVTDLKAEKIVLQKRLDALDAELKTLTGPAEKPAATAAPAPAAKVYCAVTDEEIGAPADAAGGKSEFSGKTYYFCCPSCKKKFDGEPAKFAAEADKRAAARKN